MPKSVRNLVAIGACVALGAGVWTASAVRGEREVCVARAPNFVGDGPGYELIDLFRGEVWGTRQWTPEGFERFALPWSWLFWLKNDARVPMMDDAEFRRSAGCAEDGLFTFMTAFDRQFLHVVDLRSSTGRADDQGLIRRVELEKHHILRYNAGRSVRVLTSPTGERFIGVARTLARASPTPSLPEGWILTEHMLTKTLQVDLAGLVSVLRMDNEDSYQGPLPETLRF